jgi:hypothetical protein
MWKLLADAQKIKREYLFLVLVVSLSATLIGLKKALPQIPDSNSMDLYAVMMTSDPNKPVFIQSDWTNSTRGESRGHFQGLVRSLMATNRKFVFYSVADPQAPQVARDAIRTINQERKKQGLREYKPWDDYLDLGLFPNAENSLNSFSNSIKSAWGGRRAKDSTGRERPVFDSPVLQGVTKIEDCGAYYVVSASNSIDIAIERLGTKVTMGGLVTGVMGPGMLPYYRSGQLKGLTIGLVGVYDLEYMMEHGINTADEAGNIVVKNRTKPEQVIPPVPEGTTFGQGATNNLALHIALTLMILAIALGNVGMIAKKKLEGGTK